MIECAKTDFPEPDSPTRATISPAPTESSRPSTARTMSVSVANWICRFSTCRSGFVASAVTVPEWDADAAGEAVAAVDRLKSGVPSMSGSFLLAELTSTEQDRSATLS